MQRQSFSLSAPERTHDPIARLVIIACPASDLLVPTGVYVRDLSELEAASLLSACPGCGDDHRWTPHEATFAPE